MSTIDSELQAEERESLIAIYDTDCEFDPDGNSYRVHVPSKVSHPVAVLRALLPVDYPSTTGPVLELEAARIPEQQLYEAVKEMEGMFCPGEVCMFNCIEWLREQLLQWQEQAEAAAAAAAVAAEAAELAEALQESVAVGHADSDADSEEYDEALHHLPESSGRTQDRQLPGSSDAVQAVIDHMRSFIISGPPFTERKSTFQAHVAPVTDVEQVKAVIAILLENNKIRNATHNIMAYRIAAPGRPDVFYQDCDDDGEAAAGGRLLHLLQVADVQNAVVVVSRWFGGILLGPARFGLINNTARQLLEQTGFLKQQSTSGGKHIGSKKQHKKKH